MLAISQLSMRFGAKILFKNVSLQFNSGNRYGLVGANGCGKSTLIKILAGEVTPESGQVILPQQLTLGSLSQDHYAHRDQSILDVVLQGKKKLWEALEKKASLLEKDHFNDRDCECLVKLEKVIEEEDGYVAEGDAAKLLEGLGIREEWHRQRLDVLSGGYKLRVLLAQVLFGKPDILVLDEPTNHLDLYSIKWLEGYLKQFPGILVVTSHDRDFLNAICTQIADVDYGTIKIYKGNYDQFQEQKILDRKLKEHLLQKHDKRRSDLQGFIDRFGAKATKARQAQSKARLVEKLEIEMEELDLLPSSRMYPNLSFEPLRASGITVIKAKNLTKSYGAKKVLHQVSFEIERGERVAIIGPNGIGKSTLLEILTQNQKADDGEFQWGHAVRLGYFPQDHGREISRSSTLLDWLSQYDRELPQEKIRDMLGRVLFSGDTVNQSISTLSGGETARLLLAKIMLEKPNILIFDEPTNHLDMEAIEELATALENFQGTLLLVSHNRYFVSRLANRIIEISYHGVKDFKGTYQEYLEKQEHDFLTTLLPLSQRYSHEGKESPKCAPLNSTYDDQKRVRSQLAQLRKKVLQSEEACDKIEKRIAELNALMASEGFYQRTSREEQHQFSKEKQQLEDRLLKTMEEWEKMALDLQLGEEK
ncbi:MAG: ABC-F family ATP-binding cassette domain-containing protein [Parachlamydiaceae bacterium]